MKMLRALFLASVLLWQVPAFAGTGTVTGKDATGATVTFATTTNAGLANIGQATVCDGTAAAQCAAVKPASTAAIATDPAMVVSVSPNNTIAATQSGTWNVGTVTTLTTVTNPIAATQSGNWTMRNVGNAGAILDFAGQNVASPANAFLMGGQFNTAPTTITTGNASPLQLDNAGNLLVNVKAGGAGGGAATIADGADVTQGAKADAVCASATANACSEIAMLKFIANGVIGPISAGSAIIGNVGSVATPTGGATPTGNIAPANTTAVVVKASAGTLYGIQLAGIGSVPAYLKLYNSTSSCGGTPVKRLIIPAAATAANGAGSNISFGSAGVAFTTGITYCVSTDITDTNSGAPAASTYYINIDWN